NCFLIRNRGQRLSPTTTVRVTSEATKPRSVASQSIGECPNKGFIVMLSTPSRQVDSARDRHIHVVLDVSLELDTALIVLRQINCAFDLRGVNVILLDHFLRCMVNSILVFPV